jgi:ELWxxDGT repeat protein
MKQFLPTLLFLWVTLAASAQVTLINSNRSLSFVSPIDNAKSIFASSTDQSVWVSDGTLAGTIQLSPDITFSGNIGVLNGKFLFAGTTSATGTELFITDGTPAGTVLLKDINPGTPSSSPQVGGAVLNGYLYFSAIRPAEGRELWKTNGTDAGTDILKDIVPGPGTSNSTGFYHIVSTGSYLLFQAVDVNLGLELWKSDGSNAGTALLKDINTGPDSSDPKSFTALNSNTILFTAFTSINGRETWKTDGSEAGTVLLKDINPAGSSTPFLGGEYYLLFGGKAYFNANNGVNGDELWWTDGTAANTVLFKELETGPLGSLNLIFDVVIIGNKFFFPSGSLLGTRWEIIESNGTPAGTQTFKDFTAGGEIPFLFPNYDYFSQSFFNQPLFQGNKFFFMATTPAEGRELWISDGTSGGTHITKDINPGPAHGLEENNISYIYTTSDLFFPATNTVNGIEPWRSNGTSGGTTMVADIVSNAPGSDMIDFAPLLINGRVVFVANNKDNLTETDLYAVNGLFDPIVIPVRLLEFTVQPKNTDALLHWYVAQELNCKNYTIQRSDDGKNFIDIGTVPGSGTSTTGLGYSFTDPGVISSGKKIVYYRLIITDVDDARTRSNIIAFRMDKDHAWDASIVANPVKDVLQITLSGIRENILLTIFNASGRKVSSAARPAINGQLSIPVGTYNSGIYTLQVQVGKERKIIRLLK